MRLYVIDLLCKHDLLDATIHDPRTRTMRPIARIFNEFDGGLQPQGLVNRRRLSFQIRP